jgi:hypothetical protein
MTLLGNNLVDKFNRSPASQGQSPAVGYLLVTDLILAEFFNIFNGFPRNLGIHGGI